MVEVKLHDIGEGMTEADINCYLVKAGDKVKADDPLVEVQTDKMTAEIPAPRSGVIKEILLSPGETVKVGTTLLIMEDESAGQETVQKKTAAQDTVMGVNLLNRPIEGMRPEAGAGRPSRILASPFTRKIARENNVNLAEIAGSGPAGRITDEDVLNYVKVRDSGSERSGESEGGSSGILVKKGAERSEGVIEKEVPKDPEAGSEPQGAKHSQGGSENIQSEDAKGSEGTSSGLLPFRGRRRQIAKKMVQSVYTIPHCTHFEEIDVTELIKFREELKGVGYSVSATAFFIKALSICLMEFPVFNAKLDEEKESIQLLREHHIGIAVDTPDGLIVPVIRNVNQKKLKQIHQEMKELTQRALDDKLTIKNISGGTFTISNVGPLGGSIGATPIIQHPQTALVSFHKTKKRPVVNEQDEIVIRSIMNLSMSFDHRVADGATAVAFTSRFARLIENPKMMLLELI
ncbi:dihydrolipoamide acetyltransferase family protein [Bacillus sp. REN3]|uniref:dihydrolipoamide acetyltransferase family protein n=1 Tax=Bacillus sp. REN3 TaxID=2802440 RepID=UPI001AEEF27D|nr:dihydrolipoamide acetyltransferase family protein [Bacillus sp. REN3]